MTTQKGMNIEDLLQLAREDLARNRLTSAERTVGQAILMNNQVSEAFYLLGDIYSKRGKLKKAILAFERAIALDPMNTEAAIALSSLYNDIGKYEQGAHVFKKTKKRLDRTLPGHDPRINQKIGKKHHEIAQSYMRYERFQEGLTEYQKALELDPGNIKYSVQRAICMAKTGDKIGAIQLLKQLLEVFPKSVEAKIQLGILYHTQQQLDDAFREWQEVLVLEPENRSAHMYLSMIEPASLPLNS